VKIGVVLRGGQGVHPERRQEHEVDLTTETKEEENRKKRSRHHFSFFLFFPLFLSSCKSESENN